MKVDIFNTDKKYDIIYADPPWQYKDKSCDGACEKYYHTLSVEQICELPISRLAEKDCVLFIWATYPQMKEALKVIEAWGFKYKTIAFQWDMKFNGISEFAVQRIVPLADTRFPVVYRASADSQFRAHFGLPHTVHIAVQYGKFQSGQL